jgi:hypothetical protein
MVVAVFDPEHVDKLDREGIDENQAPDRIRVFGGFGSLISG